MCPAPEGFDFYNDGLIVSDSDIACYCRPERGNNILIGSEDPPCDDHQWVDDRDWSTDFSDQWTTQALRYAQRVPSLGIPSRTRGVVELYDAATDWIPIYDRSGLPGFFHGLRNQREPVQERACGRPAHGRAHRLLRERPGPGHRSADLPARAYRPRDKYRFFLEKTRDQQGVELLGPGLRRSGASSLAILCSRRNISVTEQG